MFGGVARFLAGAANPKRVAEDIVQGWLARVVLVAVATVGTTLAIAFTRLPVGWAVTLGTSLAVILFASSWAFVRNRNFRVRGNTIRVERAAVIERAHRLALELRVFYNEQVEDRIVPHTLLDDRVRLQRWQDQLDREVLAHYERVFHDRVVASYEEMKAWRGGYDHPEMRDLYQGVRIVDEITAVARGLEGVASSLPDKPAE